MFLFTSGGTREGQMTSWQAEQREVMAVLKENGEEVESSSERQGHAEWGRNTAWTVNITLLLGGHITWVLPSLKQPAAVHY